MRTYNGPAAAGFRPMPRGLMSSVVANVDPKKIIADLVDGFEAFKANHAGEMKNVQAAYDELQARIAAMGITGGHGDALGPIEAAYSAPFAQWFRHGTNEEELRLANATGTRARVQAAMQSGDPSQGGYLAPVEWDRTVSRKLTTVSPMRRIANVVSTTTGGFSKVWAGSGWGSGWVGETAVRPQTTTPQLAAVTFRAGELYAQPALTNILLDDAQFDIQNWLAGEVADTFAQQEGIAFLAGDGVNKPQGLLTYTDAINPTPLHPGGNLVIVPSGAANNVTGDGLIEFALSLPAPYRVGARWLMSSLTAASVRKLKDGQGNYLWNNDYRTDQPASLLGFPVEIDENMPSVVAGNTPIAFGDFKRGYLINDRYGIRVLRDIYTQKGWTLYYTTKRMGGGVSDPNAIRLLKIATAPGP